MSFKIIEFTPLRAGCGNEKPTVFCSSGRTMRSIRSKYLILLCTLAASDALARKRAMNSSSSSISFCCWR
jgi:hypothetical protein